jgi:hypothetical protein
MRQRFTADPNKILDFATNAKQEFVNFVVTYSNYAINYRKQMMKKSICVKQ